MPQAKRHVLRLRAGPGAGAYLGIPQMQKKACAFPAQAFFFSEFKCWLYGVHMLGSGGRTVPLQLL